MVMVMVMVVAMVMVMLMYVCIWVICGFYEWVVNQLQLRMPATNKVHTSNGCHSRY